MQSSQYCATRDDAVVDVNNGQGADTGPTNPYSDLHPDLCLAGFTIVDGVPGSGKTRVLVDNVISHVNRGVGLDRIIVLANNFRAATQLRDDVLNRLGHSSSGHIFATPHSLALGLLGQFFPADECPKLLTSPEHDVRLAQLLAELGSGLWEGHISGEGIGTDEFRIELREFLIKARQFGLTPDDLVSFGTQAHPPITIWLPAARFLAAYLLSLSEHGEIDYTEMIVRATSCLDDPAFASRIKDQYSLVLIDDIEEFDQACLRFVQKLAGLGIPVIATRDLSQQVFSFRGAYIWGAQTSGWLDPSIPLTRIHLDVPARATGDVASWNAKVRANVVKDISAINKGDSSCSDGPAPAAFVGDGSVEIWRGDPLVGGYQPITKQLLELHHDHNLAWSQMAVISRSGGSPLVEIGGYLASAGIPHRIIGADLPLNQEPGATVLLRALQIVDNYISRQRLLLSEIDWLVTSPLIDASLVHWGKLQRQQYRWIDIDETWQWDEHNSTPIELYLAKRLDAALTDEDASDDEGLAAIYAPELDAVDYLDKTVNLVVRAVQAIRANANIYQVLWALWHDDDPSSWEHKLLREVVDGHIHRDHADREINGVRTLFDQAKKFINSQGFGGVRTFLDFIDAVMIPADSHRSAGAGRDCVEVLTAHAAKGREWEAVILFGLEEGSWPNWSRRGSIFDTDRLYPEQAKSSQSMFEVIAEERRMFLLACSRAKRFLRLWTLGEMSDADDGELLMSRFLAETLDDGLVIHYGADASLGHDLLPSDLIVELRRAAISTDRPALADVATRGLAYLASLRDRHGKLLLHHAHPSRWWHRDVLTPATQPGGDGEEVYVVSASRLDALKRCPRRMYLDQLIRRDSGAMPLRKGTAIHTIINEIYTGNLPLDQVPAVIKHHIDALKTEDRLNAFIDPGWSVLRETDEQDISDAVHRFCQWRSAQPDSCVGSEVNFDFKIRVNGPTFRIRGTIDWLAQDASGSFRVVDFKTGKTVKTKKEAEEDIQLYLYQLAVSLGAVKSVTEPNPSVSGACLVYLLSPLASDMPNSREQIGIGRLGQAVDLADQDDVAMPDHIQEYFDNWTSVHRERNFYARSEDVRICGSCDHRLGCPGLADPLYRVGHANDGARKAATGSSSDDDVDASPGRSITITVEEGARRA